MSAPSSYFNLTALDGTTQWPVDADFVTSVVAMPAEELPDGVSDGSIVVCGSVIYEATGKVSTILDAVNTARNAQ